MKAICILSLAAFVALFGCGVDGPDGESIPTNYSASEAVAPNTVTPESGATGETAKAAPIWQMGMEEMLTSIPVLALYFMETMVIGAVAVALATRLPLLANFILCFVVYVIGNLTSPLVASAEGNNTLVGFVGKLIAVVVPNLNVFNVQSAVDAGNQIPPIYLAGAFNYLVCFSIAIWMLAMLLFEDRDLA